MPSKTRYSSAIVNYGANFLQYHDNLGLAKMLAFRPIIAGTLYGKEQWYQTFQKGVNVGRQRGMSVGRLPS
jgi:hypothetical protein